MPDTLGLPNIIDDPLSEIAKGLNLKSLYSLACSNRETMLSIGRFLSLQLPEALRSRQEDSFLCAKENLERFRRFSFYKVIEQLNAGTAPDKVSKILRGEMTPDERALYDALGQGRNDPADMARYIKAHIVAGYIPADDPHIQEYIDNYLSIGVALYRFEALAEPFIRACLVIGYLKMNDVLNLSHRALEAFKDPVVQGDLITGKILNFKRILEVSLSASQALRTPFIQECLAVGRLKSHQVLAISYEAARAFADSYIQLCINNSSLTVDQVLGISETAMHAFENPYVQRCIDNGSLTVDQVLGISEQARKAFGQRSIQHCIDNGSLTVGQVLGISKEAQSAFIIYDLRRKTPGPLLARLTLGLATRMANTPVGAQRTALAIMANRASGIEGRRQRPERNSSSCTIV